MKHLLMRWCVWLLRRMTGSAMLQEARRLCAEQERRSAPGTSGEYKRHQVYAALQKRFPDVPKRQIAMAIELGSDV